MPLDVSTRHCGNVYIIQCNGRLVYGEEARMLEAALDHAEIIEILIDRGADQNMRDKGGKTALDLAANEDVRRTLARGR